MRIDAAARWLASAVATQRNEKGRRLAAVRVRDHLLPLLGPRALTSLSADDVRGYRLALEQKRLAPLTVTHVLSEARDGARGAEIGAEWEVMRLRDPTLGVRS